VSPALSFRADDEFPGSLDDWIHRLERVKEQVQNQLLQLYAIAWDEWQVLLQIGSTVTRLLAISLRRRRSTSPTRSFWSSATFFQRSPLEKRPYNGAPTSRGPCRRETILSAASCAFARLGGCPRQPAQAGRDRFATTALSG